MNWMICLCLGGLEDEFSLLLIVVNWFHNWIEPNMIKMFYKHGRVRIYYYCWGGGLL